MAPARRGTLGLVPGGRRDALAQAGLRQAACLRSRPALAVLAFSIGLAAVDVIPQLAVRPWLAQSQSSGAGGAIPRRYHLELLNAFQLLSPTALGGPADYFGADNYWETVFSIGLVPLFLAVVAVLRHPDRKLVRGWLVLVGLAVWFACGRHLGFYTVLYYLVPGMSWFRVPARSLFLANLGAAVLAGLGIQTLQRVMGAPRQVERLAVRVCASSSRSCSRSFARSTAARIDRRRPHGACGGASHS